jgi:hypothetical protein
VREGPAARLKHAVEPILCYANPMASLSGYDPSDDQELAAPAMAEGASGGARFERWMGLGLLGALLVLAAILWVSLGPSVFILMIQSAWALCF